MFLKAGKRPQTAVDVDMTNVDMQKGQTSFVVQHINAGFRDPYADYAAVGI
jgi:hypothetical protein